MQAVVREIVDAIHEAEAETIGVSSGAGGSDPTPPWWDDGVDGVSRASYHASFRGRGGRGAD